MNIFLSISSNICFGCSKELFVSKRRFFLSTHNICLGSEIRKLILDIIEYDCKSKQQLEVEFYKEISEYRTCVKTHIPGVQFGCTTVGIKQLKKKKRKRNGKTRWNTKRRKLCS